MFLGPNKTNRLHFCTAEGIIGTLQSISAAKLTGFGFITAVKLGGLSVDPPVESKNCESTLSPVGEALSAIEIRWKF